MNSIINFDLFDNTVEKFIVINPTKQQIAFFPKEESQMFQGKSYENSNTRPDGYENDPKTETENNQTRAFVNNIKATDTDPVSPGTTRNSYFETSKIPFLNATVAAQLLQQYRFGLNDITSSATATDYIGSVNVSIPFTINELFADFRFLSESTDLFTNLFSNDDTTSKLTSIVNGVQRLRIPINCFNTVLTDSTEIENNGGDDIIRNYGNYFVLISPKYIESSVIDITKREHIPLRYLSSTAIDESVYTDADNNGVPDEMEIHISSTKKRRNIYELDKTAFLETLWEFENNPNQSGRLYGSIVEIWDSTKTLLKQVKIMTENQFNFSISNKNFECVLQPDIVGYDVDIQDIAVGDILRIYPRETHFDNILIDVKYKNESLEVSSLISFLVNDTVRNMLTGIFEVYDNNGFTIDEDGQFNGTIINRYQIFQKDNFEARKKLKK